MGNDIIGTIRWAWGAMQCRIVHRYWHNEWRQYIGSSVYRCFECGRHWKW